MQINIREQCADCSGTGTIGQYKICQPCNGTGWIAEWISVRELIRLVAELVGGR